MPVELAFLQVYLDELAVRLEQYRDHRRELLVVLDVVVRVRYRAGDVQHAKGSVVSVVVVQDLHEVRQALERLVRFRDVQVL